MATDQTDPPHGVYSNATHRAADDSTDGGHHEQVTWRPRS
jgi:hypothetical protein